MLGEKPKKKSTKGVKNWRKNIDTTQEENIIIAKLSEKVDKTKMEFAKNEDLFKIDTQPVDSLPKGFLKKKVERSEDFEKKIQNNSFNKVLKNKVKALEFNELVGIKNTEANKKAKGDVLMSEKDIKLVEELWGTSDTSKLLSNRKIISLSNIPKNNLPNVPLPHPGHSYNPDKKDVERLIEKVTELNKGVLVKLNVKKDMEDKIKDSLKNNAEGFGSSSSSDSEDEENDKLEESNGKSEKKSKAKTKTERNKKIAAKLNTFKNRKDYLKKQSKKAIHNIKAASNFENIQKQYANAKEKQNKIEERKSKEKKELLRMGIYEDKDIEINLGRNVSLRNLNKQDYLRDKFEGILKQGYLGEYSNEITTRDRRNKKRNKMVIRNKNNLNNGDYGYSLGEEKTNLKIYN